MTLADVNRCDRREFVAAVGWVFEHSPWVAERAWERRPFGSVDALHAAMVDAVLAAAAHEQHGLLCAHPDLGSRAAMSAASTGEQSSAGLDGLAQDELEQLQRLTWAYRNKFGFPFLFAVKGSNRQQILAALEARFGAAVADERREALAQVARIARFRLEQLLG